MIGWLNTSGGKPLFLFCLCRRVVDFEYANAGIWISVGESIEAGTHNDILQHAPLNRRLESIFGEPASRGQESAERPCNGIAIVFLWRITDTSRDFRPQYLKRQRIAKDDRLVEELMRRA